MWVGAMSPSLPGLPRLDAEMQEGRQKAHKPQDRFLFLKTQMSQVVGDFSGGNFSPISTANRPCLLLICTNGILSPLCIMFLGTESKFSELLLFCFKNSFFLLRWRNPMENDVTCTSNTQKFLIISFGWLQGQACWFTKRIHTLFKTCKIWKRFVYG